jgi:hypothetical protein
MKKAGEIIPALSGAKNRVGNKGGKRSRTNAEVNHSYSSYNDSSDDRCICAHRGDLRGAN